MQFDEFLLAYPFFFFLLNDVYTIYGFMYDGFSCDECRDPEPG